MKTWNHRDAVDRLTNLLNRQGLGKIAEDVSTIKDPEAGQNGEGAKQQAELENAPAIAPIDSNVSENTTMTEGNQNTIYQENHNDSPGPTMRAVHSDIKHGLMRVVFRSGR